MLIMNKDDVLLFFTGMAVAGVAHEIKSLSPGEGATKALELGRTAAQAFVLQNLHLFDAATLPQPKQPPYPTTSKGATDHGNPQAQAQSIFQGPQNNQT